MVMEDKSKDWIVDIPAAGSGPLHLSMQLGDDFFRAAGHADLLGGTVAATVDLIPAAGEWRVKLSCKGIVNTLCDRCQGLMTAEVADSYEAPLLPSEGGGVPPGDDSDALYYDPVTGRADLLRPLTDTLALSLGLCHIHPEGECDPAVEAALDHTLPSANTPFADALASLGQQHGADDEADALRQTDS